MTCGAARSCGLQLFRFSSTRANRSLGRTPVLSIAACSYLANGVVGNHPLPVIPDPMAIILFQESQTYGRVAQERPNRTWDDKSNVERDMVTRLDSSQWSSIHSGGGNLSFCDGHVEFRVKSAITFVAFGATRRTDKESRCNDGIAAIYHHMAPADAKPASVDARAGIKCPTDF